MKPQDLEFETWTELFDYILESKINGQKKQSLELFNELPDRETRQAFIDYVSETYHYEAMHNGQQNELADTLKFYYEGRDS
jgi:hypothetical protein